MGERKARVGREEGAEGKRRRRLGVFLRLKQAIDKPVGASRSKLLGWGWSQ